MVDLMHYNSIWFYINPIGHSLIFQLSILIQLYYVIKEYQDLQVLGMKWIGENQVSKFNMGFINKRVTIVKNVPIKGSLLTQPLNDIVSSSWKSYYLYESFL